jgi:aspartate racemase
VKTIGLIGGMSWESTALYYRALNEAVKDQLGGLHSAKIVLYSVDFHDVAQLQRAGEWDRAGAMLAEGVRALAAAGADVLLICANTMHKVAPAIEAAVAIPLLHVADAVAVPVKQAGASVVGLLGTRFTMEQDFYRDRLRERHGLDVLVPPQDDRDTVHRIIYEELCMGEVVPASRAEFVRIMADLVARGAQAIILGCTEFAMLVGAEDATVPLFYTTSIHALAAVAFALSDDQHGSRLASG